MEMHGTICESNDDCLVGQYCYTSNRCVDYIDCSRYNRVQSQTEIQKISQCGPCMKGYTSENLIGNHMSSLCKYIGNQAGSDISPSIIIPIVIFAVIWFDDSCFFLTLLLQTFVLQKCWQKRRCISNIADISDNSNIIAVANAPLEEQKPFIGCEKKWCISDNNNEKITESNEFQNSTPCTIQYTQIGAYAPAHSNSNINNNPNNNPLSREVAIDMPYDRNTETVQSDLPNDDNLLNYNDDDTDTIDSGTEPKHKGDKKIPNLFNLINQQVTQNITINVNGEEYV